MQAPSDGADPPRRWSPIEARVAALAVTVGLYIVAIAAAAALSAVRNSWRAITTVVPEKPLLLVGVSLLMSQCSMISIWWGSSRWPSLVKSLLAVPAWVVTWALLIALLPHTEVRSAAAAGWAACFAIQALLTAFMVVVGQWWLRWRRGEPLGRFSLLFLFLWTSLIAVLLGAGKAAAAKLGWTEEVFNWEFFRQLRLLGEINASLAIALIGFMAVSKSIWFKLVAGVAQIILISIATPIVMWWKFTNVGASWLELSWLIAAQGVFLFATLVPLEIARDTTEGEVGG